MFIPSLFEFRFRRTSAGSRSFSRGGLRLLRSSRHALTRPDAYGAGASRSSANLIACGDRRISVRVLVAVRATVAGIGERAVCTSNLGGGSRCRVGDGVAPRIELASGDFALLGGYEIVGGMDDCCDVLPCVNRRLSRKAYPMIAAVMVAAIALYTIQSVKQGYRHNL